MTVDIEEETASRDAQTCFVDEIGVVLIGRNCVWDMKSCLIHLSVGIQFPPLQHVVHNVWSKTCNRIQINTNVFFFCQMINFNGETA